MPRIPRKSKKWHRRHGWVLHFTPDGRAYFTRSYARFYVGGRLVCESIDRTALTPAGDTHA